MNRSTYQAGLRAAFTAIASAIVAVAAAAALALTLAPATAWADSASRIVTLGADLTDEQEETVLEFFNLTEDDLDEMQVITVTNEDEREYLEGTLDDSIIGYVTLSCSYIQLTDSGGINVETANLTYVTSNTIYNALQTAGIENCDVVVTAPYDVSGTGALTGIFMAVEADGTELDEEKKEAATEELVETAELEDEYGEEVTEVISDVKDEVNSSDSDLSSDEISTIVEDTASEYEVSLSDEDIETITNLAESIQQLDYDTNAFSDTLSDLNSSGTGFFATIANFFQSIADFFTNLVSNITGGDASEDAGSDASDESADDDGSILDDLNTDVIQLDDASDDAGSDSGSSSTSDESAATDGSETTTDDSAATEDAATEDSGATDEGASEDAATDDSGTEDASTEDAATDGGESL